MITVVDTEITYTEDRVKLKETNDCVVRALAVAYNCSYLIAHNYAKSYLSRKKRKGVFFPEEFNGKDGVSKHAKAIVFEKRHTKRMSMSFEDKTLHEDVKSHGMPVKRFINNYPTGTYIVLSSGHAYAVKDGVIYGNLRDNRTFVKVAYKVTKTL